MKIINPPNMPSGWTARIAKAGGDKSSQDKDILAAKALARDL